MSGLKDLPKDSPDSGLTICLWYNDNAEEAVNHYASIFKDDARIIHTARYPAVGEEVHGRKAGSVMTIDFELRGQRISTSSLPLQLLPLSTRRHLQSPYRC